MFQKYLLLLLLISTSTYGADIRMPLIDISIIVPKEIKGDLYCGKSSFANIKSLEKAPEKYAQWLAISNKIDRYKDYTEFDNALYKNMWLQINKALETDIEATKSEQVDGAIVWVTSPEKFDKMIRWVIELKRLKANIEEGKCTYKWMLEYKNTNSSIVLNEFLSEYNMKVEEFNKYDTLCVKPEIKGFTNDPAAFDYVKCLEKKKDLYNNEKLRDLKNYDSILAGIMLPYLEDLKLDKKILTWRSSRYKKNN